MPGQHKSVCPAGGCSALLSRRGPGVSGMAGGRAGREKSLTAAGFVARRRGAPEPAAREKCVKRFLILSKKTSFARFRRNLRFVQPYIEEVSMKKLLILVVVGLMALSLSACVKKADAGKTRVKCPACGYEFEMPGQGR